MKNTVYCCYRLSRLASTFSKVFLWFFFSQAGPKYMDKGRLCMSRKKDPDAILKSGTAAGLEENFKKAVSEMLLLSLLSEKEMFVGEITKAMEQRSNGAYTISYPYAIIYRMSKLEYISEIGRRNADDGRLRQFYGITDSGRVYLRELMETYNKMVGCVTNITTAPAAE